YHTRHNGQDHQWFMLEGTSVTVDGHRNFGHMGMETATNWVLGAFDNPTAKVAGQASARLAAPYHPEGVAGRGFQPFNPTTSVAVAGMAPQEGDAAPLMSAPTVGLGETQKSTNDATAQKAADAVWENQSQGVLSWKKTFQIEKAEYKGICEWSRDVTGGV